MSVEASFKHTFFVIGALVASLAAGPLDAQAGDELRVFPENVTLAVSATSSQPLIAIVLYDGGGIVDETENATVTVTDPSIAEAVPITYVEGDDTFHYRYLRALAVGSTVATVNVQGLSRNVPITVVATSPPPPPPLDAVPFDLGTNLADLSNISSDLVFSDVFMTSRPWVSSTADGWGDFPQPLELDDRGWPRRLLPGQVADTMMLFELDGHFPKGSYTLTWEGEGTVVVEKGFTEVPYPRIDHPAIGATKVAEIIVGPNDDVGIRLRLTAVNALSPIHDLRLWMPVAESGMHPGNAATPPPHPFREAFLEEMMLYRRLRFGLWQLAADGTDNQAVVWDDATPVDYATQFHPWGASPEWIVRLTNVLNQRRKASRCPAQVDPWILIPYRADNSYVRGLAELLANDLDFAANPELRVHIEWANEVWNPSFLHLDYAAQACWAIPLPNCTADQLTAALTYQAHRSLEIFAIFDDVFTRTHPVPGGRDRLVRVLAGAAVNPWVNSILLGRPGVATTIDAFAIAPYFAGTVGIEVNLLAPGSLPSITELLDQIDDPSDPNNLATSDLEQRVREMAQAKALIDAWRGRTGHAIELMAYEGGQHLVGEGYDTQAHVVPLFQQANAHPRMGEMYRRLFSAWHELGGGGFNHFVHREKWWSGGFFGALVWYDEDATTADRPKHQVLLEALAGRELFCHGFESGDTLDWTSNP